MYRTAQEREESKQIKTLAPAWLCDIKGVHEGCAEGKSKHDDGPSADEGTGQSPKLRPESEYLLGQLSSGNGLGY